MLLLVILDTKTNTILENDKGKPQDIYYISEVKNKVYNQYIKTYLKYKVAK